MDEADIRRHIAEPLKREFKSALDALRATIQAIPNGEWCTGERKGLQPVREVGHLLFHLGNYLGDHRRRIGERFGVPVESFRANFDSGDCPERAAFLPWIDEVERIAMAHIDEAVERSMTGSPKQHPPLVRPTYVLRHTIVHLTMLRTELQRRGLMLPPY